MTARHIEPLTIDFQAEVARLTKLQLTAAQIAGTLKCKPARVDWARRKLGLASQAGPHQKHRPQAFHRHDTARGECLGAVYRCLEPDGVTFPMFEDHPAAVLREPIWRPRVELP